MSTHALGDEIAKLAAHLEAAEYQLISKIGEFDASGGWVDEGCISCAQWLSWRIGLSLGAAREKVRVAKVLPSFPRISKGFQEGRLSYSKVRAMTRIATPENEELLVDMGFSATASILERLCRQFRSVAEQERDADTPAEAEARRSIREQQLSDGRTRFVIDLPPEEAARFVSAIQAAMDAEDVSAETADRAKPRKNRADAVMMIAESFLTQGPAPRAGSPYEVQLHVT